MAKIDWVKAQKAHQETTQEWLDNCALEGIFPGQQTLNELAMVDASDMTSEQYLAYLNQKYPSKS